MREPWSKPVTYYPVDMNSEAADSNTEYMTYCKFFGQREIMQLHDCVLLCTFRYYDTSF